MGRPKTNQMQTSDKGLTVGSGDSDKMIADEKTTAVNMLDKAEENLDSFNHEAAKMFCLKALDIEPNCLKAVDMMANLHLDLGEVDEATTFFKQSIQLCPESGYSKYLALGQLFTGKDALEYYKKGIEILDQDIEKSKESNDDDDSIKNLLRFKSNAFCSISELYMTDYCDDVNAEDQCRCFIEKAISTDPSNPDAYQLMSSFYLVVDDHGKAREMMDKSLSLWLPLYQAVRDGQEELADGVELCPLSYSCRINAVKNCLELTQFDEAEVILNGLVEEDDEVVDVWYLLGLMNQLKGEDYHGNARFYFNKCKEVASKIGDFDEEMQSEVEERLQKLGPEDDFNDEDKENEDDDDNYEDIESSDEEMEQ